MHLLRKHELPQHPVIAQPGALLRRLAQPTEPLQICSTGCDA